MNVCVFFYIHFILTIISRLSTIYRNIALLTVIHIGVNNKKSISESKREYTFSDYLYFFSSSSLQYITEQCIITGQSNIPFPVKVFLFEIILDFFHYTFHRLFHSKKFYWIHKMHHKYTHPQILNTFYHHPIDLLFLDCIPTLIASSIIPFSSSQLKLVLVYKSFIEISGHSGKHVSGSSFPLCIWIPRILGIELYTHDHDFHHSNGTVHFSKRFSLWDRVFGTFVKTT